jgi:septal ring factor EnvC (AmiA/AmiB activator)
VKRETQYKHVIRKRDKELEELRARLHKGLANKHPAERASARVTQQFTRSSSTHERMAVSTGAGHTALQEIQRAHAYREEQLRRQLCALRRCQPGPDGEECRNP